MTKQGDGGQISYLLYLASDIQNIKVFPPLCPTVRLLNGIAYARLTDITHLISLQTAVILALSVWVKGRKVMPLLKGR